MSHLIYFVKFNFLKIAICILLCIYISDYGFSSDVDSLFQSDNIINLELRSDFSKIRKDTVGEPQYHDGELIYYNQDGTSKKLSVQVRVRGNFRRSPRNCNFPPVMVNFKKKEVKNTLFENQDKLKLVTPCQIEDDVFAEYLVYKMYNKVTDQSLKVRLVKVLYFDTARGKKVFDKYSFFIEEDKSFEERNNCTERDKFIKTSDLDRESVKRVSVFEYMIGNRDWFFTSRHNMMIMQPKDSTLLPYALPYDFDFSSFVNADYTKQKGVPEYLLPDRRIYKGPCYSEAEFNDIFEFFKKLRPEFESIINNMSLLSNGSRKEKLKYIDYFYKVVEKKELIKKEFLDACESDNGSKVIDLINNLL